MAHEEEHPVLADALYDADSSSGSSVYHTPPNSPVVRAPLHMPHHIAPARSRALRNMVGYDVPDNIGRGMDVVMHYLGPVDKRALHASGIANQSGTKLGSASEPGLKRKHNPALMERDFLATENQQKAARVGRIMNRFGLLTSNGGFSHNATRLMHMANAGFSLEFQAELSGPSRRMRDYDPTRFPGRY